MYGSTRHTLQQLVRQGRAGALTAEQIANAIDKALAADWAIVQARCAAVRARAGGGPAFAGNAAAMSVPREDLGPDDNGGADL